MTIIFSLFILLLLFSCTQNKQSAPADKLAGMYELLTIQKNDATGTWRVEDWAKGGESYILYDGKGHMMVQIIPKGYQDFQWMKEEDAISTGKLKAMVDSMPSAQLKAAVQEFASCYTYVANYSINDTAAVITHNRLAASIPVIWGTSVKRSFVFSGDTLTLTNDIGRKLVWLRQK